MKMKMGIKITIIIVAALLAAPAAASADTAAEAAFSAANSFYKSGAFDKAIAGYESLISDGAASGNLYYNLANSYLKKGEVGEAILNYERAKLFIPRDADLLANYRAAKSLMKQKDPRPDKNWLAMSLDSLFSYLTIKETFFLAAFLYYMLISLCLTGLFVNKIRSYLKSAIIIILILILSTVIPLNSKIAELENGAISVSAITDAKFEPLDRSQAHFPLYDGMKTLVLKTNEGWYKVKRIDGKIGWVYKESVKLISNLVRLTRLDAVTDERETSYLK